MPTTANDRWIVTSTGRAKIEKSARKFQEQNNRSAAFLQPRRRERIPLDLVAILQALTGDESGLIVFTAEEI